LKLRESLTMLGDNPSFNHSPTINNALASSKNLSFSHIPQDDVQEGKDQLLDLDEHGNPKREPGTAGMFSCIMNLSNTILGAGMLGLPHAFASSGYLLGSILLFVFALLSGFGLYLLANISVDHFSEKRNATFYNVATKAFSQGALVIDVAVAVKCFGVGTSYLIVVGLQKYFSKDDKCTLVLHFSVSLKYTGISCRKHSVQWELVICAHNLIIKI